MANSCADRRGDTHAGRQRPRGGRGRSGSGGLHAHASGATPSGAAKAHGAKNWHDVGITGAGVKIGVIDYGFQNYDRLVGTHLPSIDGRWCVFPFCVYVDDHGTAVAEAVMDIAPGASLYFADVHEEPDFIKAVDWMIK